MKSSTIPNWSSSGVLPPIDDRDPVSRNRSPYLTTILDLVVHFGTSPERSRILRGLLNLRNAFHQAGLKSGFQWLDGSFMEDVENHENRHPNDIDVVSFFRLPDGMDQQAVLNKSPKLGDKRWLKSEWHVDHYPVRLQSENLDFMIEQSTYWYSMWSHRRNREWKGFLQIDLSDDLDAAALANLELKDDLSEDDHE